jgi:hypothetical protein
MQPQARKRRSKKYEFQSIMQIKSNTEKEDPRLITLRKRKQDKSKHQTHLQTFSEDDATVQTTGSSTSKKEVNISSSPRTAHTAALLGLPKLRGASLICPKHVLHLL